MRMARGKSGRIVVEVESALKSRLYGALEISKITLKEWFLREANRFCDETNQPSLFRAKNESDLAKQAEKKV